MENYTVEKSYSNGRHAILLKTENQKLAEEMAKKHNAVVIRHQHASIFGKR